MKTKRNGFTLVEIMIVVVIVGILATIAIPAFRRVQMNSRSARFISDVRQFAGSIENYMLTEGTVPNNGNNGVLPDELKPYIKVSDFEVRSPLGGKWDVEVNASGIVCAVGAAEITADNDQLMMIENNYDDGNLATGRYQQIKAGGFYVVLEE